MKKTQLLLLSALVLSVSLPLHAQSACVQSPENPTIVLALLGSAGAFAVSARDRIRAYRSKK
jgi:XrtJ-associated TM-motif-TM protein